MNILAAGQSGLDDWIQIIILVLIVGGSVFGAISKKLIAVFSPKEDTSKGTGDVASKRRPPTPASRVQPGPSAQRPAQPTRQPPITRPYPSRPMPAAPVAGRGEPRRPTPASRPPSQRLTPPKPIPVSQQAPQTLVAEHAEVVARPSPARRRDLSEPACAQEHLGHIISALDEEGELIDTTVEDHLGHLESRLGIREDRFDEAVEERLGRVEPESGTQPCARPAGAPVLAIGSPSRRALRRAVVMSEILAPPLALRPSSDRF